MIQLWNDHDIIDCHYEVSERVMYALFPIAVFMGFLGFRDVMAMFALPACVMLIGKMAYQGSNYPTDYWIPVLAG